MAIGSVIGSVVSSLVMAGISAAVAKATTPKFPSGPDYSSASEAAIEADVGTLPARRAISMAAALGQPITTPTGATHEEWTFTKPDGKTFTAKTEQEAIDKLWKNKTIERVITSGPNNTKRESWVYTDPKTGKTLTANTASQLLGEMQENPQAVSIGYQYKPNVPTILTADFTGMGDVDLQAKTADDMAKFALDLQKTYGTRFVEEAREQEKAADPLGWAAREELVKQLDQETPISPVSQAAYDRMMADLQAGKSLGTEQMAAVQSAISNRGALGDAASANLPAELERGSAGEARKQSRLQQAMQVLASGSTPEDISYRRRQQQMANRGAFLSNTSPVTQFSNLSGAQQGATPMVQGQALPTANANAGQMLGLQQQSFATQVNNMKQQANPWFAGLSTALKGAQTVAAAT